MKKTGFTLAEVLITLTIIGVVAMMTLPALMNNTSEQQARTAIKKAISTLTDVGSMAETETGDDYSGLINSATDPAATVGDVTDSDQETTLAGFMRHYLQVDNAKTEAQPTDNNFTVGDSNNFALFLKDGSAYILGGASSTSAENGEPHGYTVIYDMNGTKGPNILSNCVGETTARYELTGTNATAEKGTTVKTQCVQDNRVIKDRFTIRLQGKYAIPNGAAARYLYEK